LLCRYPNLHVYAYGPLPCLDPVIADACSEFVTSSCYVPMSWIESQGDAQENLFRWMQYFPCYNSCLVKNL
ncbi:unnamed protein product, partial [Thlaspi arvense]